MDDPFQLERFLAAQAPIYAHALAELREGDKRSHWMWFVFPQIAGLGASPMAQRYAIGSLDEARAYLAHPVLGGRLRESIAAVMAVQDRSARQILGSPDDLKFRSSMTLFREAASGDPMFQQALDKHFAGEPDPLTLELLSAQAG